MSGKRLATIKRKDQGKPEEELRMTWEEYQGHPFLQVQWWKKIEGKMQPDPQRKFTIRRRELAEFANGAGLAIEMTLPVVQRSSSIWE